MQEYYKSWLCSKVSDYKPLTFVAKSSILDDFRNSEDDSDCNSVAAKPLHTF